MSLTTALVIAAAVALLALALHGVWQARRAGPRRADPVATSPQQRVDPTLGTTTFADTTQDAPAADADVPRGPTASPRRGARIDALIDAIAPLAIDAPLSGEHVLAHLPSSRRAGSKPLHIEGLSADSGEWEPIALGQRYSELQAGVQLANRSGALNEIEYSEFVQKVQALADAIGALPDFPDMLDVVARARELDAFASPNDANLTALLRANTVAWSVGYIQQCAARQHVVPGTLPGRLVLPGGDDAAPPQLVLSFDAQAALAEDPGQAAVRQLTLALDVAQTPESAEPFAAWQQAIRALAEDMDATAVDDQGQPITLHHFAAIAAELKALYRTLEARDIAAGSPTARRLFS